MSSRGKFFIVNNNGQFSVKTNPPKPQSPPVSSLPSMTIGGAGDPHMYLTVSSLDNKKRTRTKRVATWDDNKTGTSGNNELKLIDLQTTTQSVKIFYTNRIWTQPMLNGAKVIANIRVEINGVSTTYTNTAKVTAGPISLSVIKFEAGGGYLTFEASWNTINNIVKLGGAIVPILKRVADNNGNPWRGPAGRFADGFAAAGAPYGLSRSVFETGIGIQSEQEELVLREDEAEFLAGLEENFVQEGNIFDDFNDENGVPVAEWDETTTEVLQVLDNPVGLEGVVDQIVSSGTTTTTTTTTAAPTTTTTTAAPVGTLLFIGPNSGNNGDAPTDSGPSSRSLGGNSIVSTYYGDPVVGFRNGVQGNYRAVLFGGRTMTFSDLSLGTSNFTFETWILPISVFGYPNTNVDQIFGNSAFSFKMGPGNGLLKFFVGGSQAATASSGAVDFDSWTHIAAVRSGSDLYLYANGSRVASGTSSDSFSGSGMTIGNFGSGLMAQIRIVFAALYTGATYTIPTPPL